MFSLEGSWHRKFQLWIRNDKRKNYQKKKKEKEGRKESGGRGEGRREEGERGRKEERKEEKDGDERKTVQIYRHFKFLLAFMLKISSWQRS